ncbi:response regulator transcription factor [Paenibacillus oenotherae]|uniref:Response regulator transcription factor n=1 Tax=Paenibacillus oenotherae TaxID=1435645 RepID=A0ABS7DCG6_9BACL|nr:response regulator transcription factor [Paenibacillus oenotherae]MBW7477620.1 response regulator transcription factor [Paenibacillus oenotherae]
MMERTIKVLLVEDDPFWQDNISKYIEREGHNIEVAFVTGSKEEALRFAEENEAIDVVLLDLNLSRAALDGIELIEQLSRLGSKVIALTAIMDEHVIVSSFESGAVNYMNKSSIYDIIAAIKDAAEGKTAIHHDASPALIARIKEEKKVRILTPSEQEIYYLQQKGLSKKAIADTLLKSTDTVKKHMQSIKKKLNL